MSTTTLRMGMGKTRERFLGRSNAPFDQRDGDAFVVVYASDGRLTAPVLPAVVGRNAIRGYLEAAAA
jgi:hypothetical protein